MTEDNTINEKLLKVIKSQGGPHLERIKELIEQGADINYKNGSPLIEAIYSYTEVSKYLIKNGADIHAQDDLAFITACEVQDVSIFNYLINEGANINAQDNEAFIRAAENGQLYITSRLEELGIDI